MAGAGSSRRALGGVALLLAASLGLPGAAAGGERASQVLDENTLTAAVVDLDGDGSHEIVRIAPADVDGIEVEAFAATGGDWSSLGSARLRPGVGDGTEPVGADAGIGGLLPWTGGGRERVLVMSAVLDVQPAATSNCCLRIAEVRLDHDRLVLVPMPIDDSSAEFAQAVDLDGDGTDELLLHGMRSAGLDDPATFSLELHRWDGERFTELFAVERDEEGYSTVVGESDGQPGEDVLIAQTRYGPLQRLAWIDGAVVMEAAPLDLGGRRETWPVGVVDERIVLLDEAGIVVARWPRGSAARSVAELASLRYPFVQLVGDDADAVLIVSELFGFTRLPERPSATVYDLDLRSIGTVELPEAAAGLWRLVQEMDSSGLDLSLSAFPYAGPIPGGVDGRAAYAMSGLLIQAAPKGVETRPMASIVGLRPVGRAGPGDGWMVLGADHHAPVGGTYLLGYAGLRAGAARLVVMPVDELLRPDTEFAVASIELRGAVEVARENRLVTLMADGGGFQAIVTAEPGATVIVIDGRLASEHPVAADGTATIEVRPRRNAPEQRNLDLARSLIVLAPDGRAALVEWRGTFVRQSPTVTARVESRLLEARATVRGQATPGTSVSIDGAPVSVSRLGAFVTQVDAPIWPRDVVVAVRDPLGHEATTVVQVVGVVDYRGWPWAAIIGAATLGTGAVLFMRIPRRRSAASDDGDGRLEDLDASAIDDRTAEPTAR